MRRHSLIVIALAGLIAAPALAQAPPDPNRVLRRTLQIKLDSMRAVEDIIGVTFGVALSDGSTIALASGESDTAKHVRMRPTDRMLQGSVGKTYVSAVALQLVHEGKLKLDDKISVYLGNESWFSQLPNAATITVRQLMTHTSGLVRYEFQPKFEADLRAQPMKSWTPQERLGYIFGTKAPFEAGKGWEYSDTNYIVLGMIIEKLSGATYYAEVRRRVLDPLMLTNTIPSDNPDLPGVVNGYAGKKNDLGGYDASIVNGKLAVNPGLEWTGGGMASTADDLARWGRLLYEGKAFDPALLPKLLEGVPSKLGRGVTYGLGVIIRTTPVGRAYGHSGFFPGYATEMLYFPNVKAGIAIQANVSSPYPRGMVAFLIEAAQAIQIAKR